MLKSGKSGIWIPTESAISQGICHGSAMGFQQLTPFKTPRLRSRFGGQRHLSSGKFGHEQPPLFKDGLVLALF